MFTPALQSCGRYLCKHVAQCMIAFVRQQLCSSGAVKSCVWLYRLVACTSDCCIRHPGVAIFSTFVCWQHHVSLWTLLFCQLFCRWKLPQHTSHFLLRQQMQSTSTHAATPGLCCSQNPALMYLNSAGSVTDCACAAARCGAETWWMQSWMP